LLDEALDAFIRARGYPSRSDSWHTELARTQTIGS
jgi:hypothetical protein